MMVFYPAGLEAGVINNFSARHPSFSDMADAHGNVYSVCMQRLLLDLTKNSFGAPRVRTFANVLKTETDALRMWDGQHRLDAKI